VYNDSITAPSNPSHCTLKWYENLVLLDDVPRNARVSGTVALVP
jgi:hypothetical protein